MFIYMKFEIGEKVNFIKAEENRIESGKVASVTAIRNEYGEFVHYDIITAAGRVRVIENLITGNLADGTRDGSGLEEQEEEQGGEGAS